MSNGKLHVALHQLPSEISPVLLAALLGSFGNVAALCKTLAGAGLKISGLEIRLQADNGEVASGFGVMSDTDLHAPAASDGFVEVKIPG